MRDAKIFERQMRERFPDCRVEEEIVSQNLTRFYIFVGEKFYCAESGLSREMAFKYALEEIDSGRLQVPERIEQFKLW